MARISRLAVLLIISLNPLLASTAITAVWANDGGDKVTQDELRVTLGKENLTGFTRNRVWDGHQIHLFGGRNEEVSFNLIIEAGYSDATNVAVSFDTLTGPNGAVIHSQPAAGNGVFNWVNRPIELFYARYLQIRGLSFFGYTKWDERQIPARFRRPADGNGNAYPGTSWFDRPDHDKYYPDPLVPLEAVTTFNIANHSNQSIWCDIYLDPSLQPGTYTGSVIVSENGKATYSIPVSLSVLSFNVPDSKPKLFSNLSNADVMHRFVSTTYVNWGSPEGRRVQAVTDKYYQLFHKHRMALIGDNECPIADRPCDSSITRLDGSLYQPGQNYSGPNVGVVNGIYSVGTYGTWNFGDNEQDMWNRTNNWMSWFQTNLPTTDVFLYEEDEPPQQDFAKVDQWAKWLNENPGVGHAMLAMSTVQPVFAKELMPHLDVPMMAIGVGVCPLSSGEPCNNTPINQQAADYYRAGNKRRLWAYGDSRPGAGSNMTEDDGVATRAIAWAQYKMGIDRWFYWFANLDQQTDLFNQAVTWDYVTHFDNVLGWVGNSASNGNGIMAYPGTDLYNPGSSYNLAGPIASLRMKNWRRGLQDAEYLAVANRIDSVHTAAIISRVMPKALWEYNAPVPSYYNGGGPSWSPDPDIWEGARAELADMIASYCRINSDPSESACTGIASTNLPTVSLDVYGSAVGGTVTVSGIGCSPGQYALPITLSILVGQACSFSILPPSGYSFASWNVGGQQVSSPLTFNAASRLLAVFSALPVPQAVAPPTAPNAVTTGLRYVPINPCRILDTREADGPFGGPYLAVGTEREIVASDSPCKIPTSAKALALNATVIPLQTLRWLTIWPSDQLQPFVSTLNSYDGRTKANGQITAVGANGGIKVLATEKTNLILDVNGYFVADSAALGLHAIYPCRVIDTRDSHLVAAGVEQVISVLDSPCGIPKSAQAYSIVFTAIPKRNQLGWITSWPTGSQRPTASILNATTGAITANTAIIAAGLAGQISVYGSDDFDLIADITGYFDQSQDGLKLYPVTPCRQFDSRDLGKAVGGDIAIPLTASCGVPASARGLAVNVTAVPLEGQLSYLTMWPSGNTKPLASVLNAYDGQVTSNSTLISTGSGTLSVFSTQRTHVILDVSGYFAF